MIQCIQNHYWWWYICCEVFLFSVCMMIYSDTLINFHYSILMNSVVPTLHTFLNFCVVHYDTMPTLPLRYYHTLFVTTDTLLICAEYCSSTGGYHCRLRFHALMMMPYCSVVMITCSDSDAFACSVIHDVVLPRIRYRFTCHLVLCIAWWRYFRTLFQMVTHFVIILKYSDIYVILFVCKTILCCILIRWYNVPDYVMTAILLMTEWRYLIFNILMMKIQCDLIIPFDLYWLMIFDTVHLHFVLVPYFSTIQCYMTLSLLWYLLLHCSITVIHLLFILRHHYYSILLCLFRDILFTTTAFCRTVRDDAGCYW